MVIRLQPHFPTQEQNREPLENFCFGAKLLNLVLFPEKGLLNISDWPITLSSLLTFLNSQDGQMDRDGQDISSLVYHDIKQVQEKLNALKQHRVKTGTRTSYLSQHHPQDLRHLLGTSGRSGHTQLFSSW